MPRFEELNFSYRGKSLDYLRGMELKDFISLLDCGTRRYIEQNFNTQHVDLLVKCQKALKSVEGQPGVKPPMIKTRLRTMIVFPCLVDNIIGIYNGKDYVPIHIRPDMIGHRLGDFAMTKAIVQYGKVKPPKPTINIK